MGQARGPVLTLGVEEEYLLLDAATGRPVELGEEIRQDASVRPALEDEEVQHELLTVQVEVATPISHELDEVGGHLLRLRHEVGDAAQRRGTVLAPVGAAPWFEGTPTVADSYRYRGMTVQAPALVGEQFICGMHVHVGVPDREAGVEVLNRLRVDLPVLVAIGGNSPFWRGRDSGFDSWRTVHFQRWQVEGPPPHFAGADDYDRRVDALVETGAIFDRGQIYWQARLSERFPTIEVRAMDVQLRADDAVLLAGLVRALVATALDDVRRGGGSPPVPEQELVRAATWLAARRGLGGELYDLRSGRRRRSGDVVVDLLHRVEPALEVAGDAEQVHKLVDRLLREGNGAARQRDLVARQGFSRLPAFLAEQLVGT